MQETKETRVPALAREDALEEGLAPHSVFLPGEPQGLRSLAVQAMASQRGGHDWVTPTHAAWWGKKARFCLLEKKVGRDEARPS